MLFRAFFISALFFIVFGNDMMCMVTRKRSLSSSSPKISAFAMIDPLAVRYRQFGMTQKDRDEKLGNFVLEMCEYITEGNNHPIAVIFAVADIYLNCMGYFERDRDFSIYVTCEKIKQFEMGLDFSDRELRYTALHVLVISKNDLEFKKKLWQVISDYHGLDFIEMDLIRIFLKAGASRAIKDIKEKTPVELADKFKDKEIKKIFDEIK